MITRTRTFAMLVVFVAVLFPPTLFAEAKDASWKPLFNGTNFDGLYIYIARQNKNEDTNQLVQIENGTWHMYAGQPDGSAQPHGYVSTEKEYADYHLRFEYKWGTNRFGARATAKRDAGVIYHMFGGDTVWPSGVECQVQEGDVGDIFTVNTRVKTTVDPKTTNLVTSVITNTNGTLRTNQSVMPVFLTSGNGGVALQQGVAGGIRRVIRSQMLEHDGWNTVEVIVRGDEATHIVNGKTNNVAGKMEKLVGGQWQPLTKGKLIFQLEGAEVFYRHLEIKELNH
ncbi:MAG: DUF1080 domain-containing protein [Pedosphaera sp.]|nr:DUF1080 domain-containing protein [Pedosphaera sp.]